METKLVRLSASNKEFLKWCEANEKDSKKKRSALEYLAIELDNDDAKKVLKDLENGNTTLEKVKIAWIESDEDDSENDSINDTNLEGLKELVLSILKLGYNNEDKDRYKELTKEINDNFEEVDKKMLKYLYKVTIERLGKDLICAFKCITGVIKIY